MTKSTNHPDADYTPNDMGPPASLHYKNEKPFSKEEEEKYYEKMEECVNDLVW